MSVTLDRPAQGHRRRARGGAALSALWRRDVAHTLRNQSVMISALFIPSVFFLAFYASFSQSAEAFMDSYADYLLPAGVMQAIIFAAGGSTLAVSQDAEDGFHQRLLSLPSPTWLIVAGRMLADITRTLWSGTLVLVVAMLCGARFHGGPLWTLAFFLGAILISLALCAGCDGLCLLAKNPVSASFTFQGLTIAILMLSTAFVPASALPSWVRDVIAHLPISVLLDTLRGLMAGHLGAENHPWEALAWLIVLLVCGFWGFSFALKRGHRV
ncbi:ABC transporter permease [Corynebacterium uropygiale]|uniref:Transport permease protein n=1 Tax=Corynebacterium uropygiale TaxID=1775911 RepID=A0A9X1TZN8_9CORY|nr:ABC transporter permease [Corynebacterium uropygiale]MCF4005914.1 ABC transporter permease [Corynebacterium uropygiale]